MSGLIGKKLGMSQVFIENGDLVPVTYISVNPNVVTQIKSEKKDGCSAIVVGVEELKKPSKTKKYKHLKEFKITEGSQEFKIGDKITIESLKDIEEVIVSGVSKGKGFQGVMKKYNFGGGPKTHGSNFHRKPGSIGACAEPGRVAKGKKLPGQMGDKKITLLRRKIIDINVENNVFAIKGPLPGANNSLIFIKY